jgi:hypothetical protein
VDLAATESGDKPGERTYNMIPIDTPSVSERAEEVQAKVQGWQLFWRFFWSAGAIAGTVGVAALAAHWVRG